MRKEPPWLVSDDLWDRVEPLLPVRRQRLGKHGRPPLDDRGCLQGILFVLHTGIQWEWPGVVKNLRESVALRPLSDASSSDWVGHAQSRAR